MWGNEDVGNAWYSPFENILQSCPMITMPNKWPEHAIKKLKLQFEMWNSWQLHPFIFQLQKGHRIMSQILLYMENDAVVFVQKRAATTPQGSLPSAGAGSASARLKCPKITEENKHFCHQQWFNNASTQNNFFSRSDPFERPLIHWGHP